MLRPSPAQRLQNIWYGTARPPWLLRLLSGLFGAAARVNRLRPRVRGAKPVIVVGNLSVGGSGKTPLVVWLVGQLRARGLRPGVILRGYRGSAERGRTPVLVQPDSDPARVGDEALLLRLRCAVPVVVCRDRVRAAERLLAEPVDVIVADDGLQHYRLARACELAVLDAQRALGNGYLLPAGPLREPAARLAQVDAVILNGEHDSPALHSVLAPLPASRVFRMQLAGGELRSLDGSGAALPLMQLAGQRVHAVAGIGHPERFFALLRAAGLEPIEHVFEDHHRFSAQDLQFPEPLPLLMTEKDAVKCRGFAAAQRWYVPISAELAGSATDALMARVCGALLRSGTPALQEKLLEARLLDILACPVCKGPLLHERKQALLICRVDRLAFPIRDGYPVMLEDQARQLNSDDPLLER